MLKLQNGIDNEWTEFGLVITMVSKEEFRATWSDNTKEYLIGIDTDTGSHCLYVEKIEMNGELLACLNSWGKDDDPNPKKNTQTLDDDCIFAVELFILSTAAATINSRCSRTQLMLEPVAMLRLLRWESDMTLIHVAMERTANARKYRGRGRRRY